ncbi:MAG: PASTA domain-containing protein [Candidatus Symbiothrix sp.]|jgi:beta-lactam-binding protein with PASTA domain|nr:PASTA domain-containing protein [Candidatus Symbiothrix sp.]
MNLKKYFFNVYTFNLMVAVAIAVVLILLTLAWLKVYTNHGQQVTVPDVKGLQLESATPLFTLQKLQYAVVDSIYVKNKPAGCIIETVPPVGTHVKEGRTIYLTLNAYTAHLLTIPSIIDLSQPSALRILTTMGFEKVSSKTVPGNYADLVVALENDRGQRLLAGDRIPANTQLILFISSGYEAVDSTVDTEAVLESESAEYWY